MAAVERSLLSRGGRCREVAIVERWPLASGESTVYENDKRQKLSLILFCFPLILSPSKPKIKKTPLFTANTIILSYVWNRWEQQKFLPSVDVILNLCNVHAHAIVKISWPLQLALPQYNSVRMWIYIESRTIRVYFISFQCLLRKIQMEKRTEEGFSLRTYSDLSVA